LSESGFTGFSDFQDAVPILEILEFCQSCFGQWGGWGMSSEWNKKSFGDVVSFVSEKASALDTKLETYVSTENMIADFGGISTPGSLPSSGSVTKFIVGDTLFSNIRTYFKKVWQAKFNGLCSNDVLVFRPKDKNNLFADYLFYLCQWEKFTELSVRTSKGAKMPRGDKYALAQFNFSLPPLPEQRAIAHILGTLDDKIENNRRMNATLEAMAQALFKSWFVDFDPVRAKAEGRAPEGMDAATAALFPARLVDSELGEVPEGWGLVPFGNLLAHSIGGDWGKEEADEKHTEQVVIVRGTDIPTLRSCLIDGIPIRFTTNKKLCTRKLQDGDIVIEVSGGSTNQPTGRSIYFTDNLLGFFNNPITPASFCRLFRGKSPEICLFLGQHLQYIYTEGKTWNYQVQSTGISNFQTTMFLEKEKVFVPSDEILKSFYELVRPLIEKQYSKEIMRLSELRDTLLPKLISGELRVPEATKKTGTVL
jgi:type I restriction enzyme S subunit